MTYAAALEELENIMQILRTGQIDVDELEGKTQRASELITWCRNRLRTVEGQLSKIDATETGELF